MKHINFKSIFLLTCVTLSHTANAGVEEANTELQKKDYAAALQEYSAAAKTGDNEAGYLLAKFYRSYMQVLPLEQGGNLAADANEEKLPKQFSTIAPHFMPCGSGVMSKPSSKWEFELRKKYLDMAQNLFEQSAAKGNAKAQYCLGIMKLVPLDDPKATDYTLATKFLAASSLQKYGPAEYWMGYAYHFGLGVEKNEVVSSLLMERAAQDGSEFAKATLQGTCCKDVAGP